jgi:NADH:ubiquinone oxidoreductase subunit K
LNDIVGEILSLYLLTASAGELAIGLALVINSYRIKGTISIKSINLDKFRFTFAYNFSSLQNVFT